MTLDRVKRSAIVFAPHQDDETLGCGGTIMLKRGAGTRVACVFLTDGATSHRLLIDEDELRSLRKMEAINATRVLGIDEEDVHFLGLPDGQLGRFHAEAVARVRMLLQRYRPDEVYVPHRADGTPDHESTYAVVLAALNETGRRVEILEYPIWLWNQWPWVPLRIPRPRTAARMLVRLLWSGLGLRLMAECRSGVFVGDLLERKRHALAQHRSQMTVFKPGTAWPTLGAVSDGDFLKWFFQEFEIFRCRTFPGQSDGSA